MKRFPVRLPAWLPSWIPARLLGILAYLTLALWLLGFNVRLLFDLKSLLLVLFGTLLLTAGCYKKGMPLGELRDCALWNSMLAGFFTSFMLLFSILSQSSAPTGLFPGIAPCIRPLFYTFIIQSLCRPAPESKNSDNKEPAKQPSLPPTPEEIKYLLREQELTDRELEIALAIWKNMPNKEIAELLFISESTVKKHSTSLYKKLGVSNREQLKQYLDDLRGH